MLNAYAAVVQRAEGTWTGMGGTMGCGMAPVEGEIIINRPVEEVFDFVADERNEPHYNPRMVRAEKISEGQIGSGTRFHTG